MVTSMGKYEISEWSVIVLVDRAQLMSFYLKLEGVQIDIRKNVATRILEGDIYQIKIKKFKRVHKNKKK